MNRKIKRRIVGCAALLVNAASIGVLIFVYLETWYIQMLDIRDSADLQRIQQTAMNGYFTGLFGGITFCVSLGIYIRAFSRTPKTEPEPSASSEPPPAATVQDATEPMKPQPQDEAPADDGGR